MRRAAIFLGFFALILSLLMAGFLPLRVCLVAADLRVCFGEVRRQGLREGRLEAAAAVSALLSSPRA